MSEELSNLQFQILSRKIGEVVSCKVWEAGEAATYVGQLMEIIPFDAIKLDSQLIPFVGSTQAIEEITLNGTDRVLYTNLKVKGYNGFDEDVVGLANAQTEFLGKSIIMEKALKSEEGRKHR